MWWILLIIFVVVSMFIKIALGAGKEYKCPNCGCVFRPKLNNSLRLLLNFPSGGSALKCPECKNKSIMYEDKT